MVLNATSVITDQQGIISSLVGSLPQSILDKISLVVDLSKILMIILIVYFVLIIISKIMKLRDSSNLAKIAKNVEEINQKIVSKEKKLKKKD